MSNEQKGTGAFDIVIVADSGRLTYEAVLFAASLRYSAPEFSGCLFVAEPQPGPLWARDPRIADPAARELLVELGATLLPFENRHFGENYPHGNKIEALAALCSERPFVYFDSDTLITGPVDDIGFDFDRPSASMERQNTWPQPPLYGPGYEGIWRSVYERFGVPFETTLDHSEPEEHWRRYLYFNASWFYYRSAPKFADRMIQVMTGIRDDTPPELACQSLDPWLDQIALPVVVSALGGGRPGAELNGLDGAVSHHWRALPLFYARADDALLARFQEITSPNRIKKVLKNYEPFRRMIYQRRGDRVRALFDRQNLPPNEKAMRNRIRREKLWMR